ncbi:MAG: bifunctional ornithine acetyltransferase/N-acetylglutamate synthase [Methanophagales archaeon]|nr:bifunctional ornithine acetyltransferase/N-acetylglutamate synthase [Methanophagales archaeon]MCW7070585.1 bifunctional ornithine acetyltransferase/N-acetylglutamate synthase [Methanophagales archaeon]MCW7073991.1 bifunctional ornithine acetyltransferase/N-acetylglutamate synthase [Methanophagales archaeon]
MEIEVLRGGICAVSGVRAYGIRENNRGLALIEGKGKAVGMFTMNKMKAAPLIFTQRLLLENGRISAIIANSGCANSFTGEEGMRNANRMAELASAVLGVDKSEVAVASTGPIGKQLDIAMIARQVQEVAKRLTSDPEGSAAAAKAIMTTDTFPKELAIKVGEVTIGGIAKGSGMIYPHLATATMLAFIYTDAELDRETMRTCLKDACDNSFNMIVVDGDMSTNDMVLLVSRGGKEISAENFKTGLNYLCKELAKMIARDGEGATKFIEVNVSLKGAPVPQGDAKLIAREILRSPLVKSAIFGERIDLACGRIIAAIGSCTSTSTSTVPEVEVISMKFRGKEQEAEVVRNGRIVGRWNHEVMKGKELTIDIVLGGGEGESEGEKETTATATAWGCDLSCDYVMLNASML